MENFGSRFLKERNDENSAILCYILAKNFGKVVGLDFIEMFGRDSSAHCKIAERWETHWRAVLSLLLPSAFNLSHFQKFEATSCVISVMRCLPSLLIKYLLQRSLKTS